MYNSLKKKSNLLISWITLCIQMGDIYLSQILNHCKEKKIFKFNVTY